MVVTTTVTIGMRRKSRYEPFFNERNTNELYARIDEITKERKMRMLEIVCKRKDDVRG